MLAQIIGYLIFIVSAGLAALGVVLASRLRNSHNNETFSSLLYYQVFIITSGFYIIWGQTLIKAYLSGHIADDLISRFASLLMLLGLPFLVFAWLMLIRFSAGLSGRRDSKYLVPGFLMFNFSVLIILGYLIAKVPSLKPESLIRYYYIVFSLIYTFISAGLILFPSKKEQTIHEYDRKRIAASIVIAAVIEIAPLLFFTYQPVAGMVFTVLFFTFNTFLPVYLSYATMITATTELAVQTDDSSFETFCKKYDVSPRETDIVREICNGLSNKEISEKLFISLQTVKDHTHRIYIKTNVRSRVQLIYLVKELKSQI